MDGARFATAADYRAVFPFGGDDQRLQGLLDRASRLVDSELRRVGIGEGDERRPTDGDLMDVCVSVVRRALPDEGAEVPFGASQFNMTANGFTTGFSMSNPMGDMYLSKGERRRLGISRGRIGSARIGRA